MGTDRRGVPACFYNIKLVFMRKIKMSSLDVYQRPKEMNPGFYIWDFSFIIYILYHKFFKKSIAVATDRDGICASLRSRWKIEWGPIGFRLFGWRIWGPAGQVSRKVRFVLVHVVF